MVRNCTKDTNEKNPPKTSVFIFRKDFAEKEQRCNREISATVSPVFTEWTRRAETNHFVTSGVKRTVD